MPVHYPDMAEATEIVQQGHDRNPGSWLRHCKNVARAAQMIAQKCNMDGDKAYSLGLLHDIGYSCKDGTCHIIAGRDIMLSKGYTAAAKICMTHSFPIKNINYYIGKLTFGEHAIISEYLNTVEYDEYDMLIQLSDALATANGICILEQRLVDVAIRHGVNSNTTTKWQKYFNLLAFFNDLSGDSIYNIFADEILLTAMNI